MKRWEEEAIRLKYLGKTHREIAGEISKLCKVTISPGTISNCFNVDGRLYLDYLTYESKQNGWAAEHSMQEYKRLAANTAKIKESLLKMAVEKGDYRLAFDIARDLDDRAGNVVVRKSEVDDKRKEQMTDEQLLEELTRIGINPRTGLRVKTPKMEQN